MFRAQPQPSSGVDSDTMSKPFAISDQRVVWLVRHARPHLPRMAGALVLTMIAGGVSVIDPLVMKHLIDRSLPSHQMIYVVRDVLLIAACFLSRPLLTGAGGLIGLRVTQGVGVDLKTELLARMNALSADWHEQTPLGEKLSRIDSDVDQIAQFSADALNSLVRVVLLFALNLVVMLKLSLWMTLSMTPLLVVFYGARQRFKPLIQANARRSQDQLGNAIGEITEHLDAIPQLHLLGASQRRMQASVGIWQKVLTSQWHQRKVETAFSVTISMVMGLATLLVLAVGSYGFIRGTVTLGTIVAFYAYIARIFEPLTGAMELYARSQRMLASVGRVFDVIAMQPSIRDGEEMLPPAPVSIELVDVSFRYRTHRWTLRHIDLSIGASETIGLIGPSGSGKSSLARLLVRFADPTEGVIRITGTPAQAYLLSELRHAICYVPQRPVIFRGSIRDNLLYANASADDRKLEQVVHVAQLDAVIRRLPAGLDHVLEPGGSGLSGGEQQRLAVARALLQESPLLVLDESTSALDVLTEASLLRAVRGFRSGMTTVFISHRVRSLSWVDRFVLLDAGRIVACGSHASLSSENALYRDLFVADQEASDGETRVPPSHIRQQAVAAVHHQGIGGSN